MSIAVSTIQSLIGQYPLGTFSAHTWYSDHPTDSDLSFSGKGHFSGGDLPFGLIFEVHNTPSGTPTVWQQSVRFATPMAHLVNNAAIGGGFGSSLPVEEFILDRPRGIITFAQPTTTSIDLEMVGDVFLELWGLYIDIPLITPDQMTWHQDDASGVVLDPYTAGAVHTALTDQGTLALGPHCIGVQINVSSLPSFIGSEFGSPNNLWNVGWVNWGDGFGFREREFITAQTFQTFPRRPSYAPALGYSLSPGVSIDVTELLDRQWSLSYTLR